MSGNGERLGDKGLRMSRDEQRSGARFERALILLPRWEKMVVLIIGIGIDN